MGKLRKVSDGCYVIVASDGSIVGDVQKMRGQYFARPKGEMMPTHCAKTLAQIRQAIKGV